MEAVQPPEFIKLLANNLRWSLLKALTVSDLQVNELVAQLQQPMNLISYHLKKMRTDALVTTRRSEADGRDIYYSLDLNRLRQMYLDAGMELHPAIGSRLREDTIARLRHQRILFVCTHNSARSQMAEGILRHLSQGYLDVVSAGSHPTSVHPDAIRAMDTLGIDIRLQQSRPLSDVEGESFDYVITVCDKAREVCPTFPGSAMLIHWSFPDPVIIQDNKDRVAIFEQTALQLESRIRYFLSTLPQENENTL
jgi:ArsR family transcriptional regulator, arsenate/arsenite/antimonite-responsive transcriptional repressor / arsenate reductase (thioredoxin)